MASKTTSLQEASVCSSRSGLFSCFLADFIVSGWGPARAVPCGRATTDLARSERWVVSQPPLGRPPAPYLRGRGVRSSLYPSRTSPRCVTRRWRPVRAERIGRWLQPSETTAVSGHLSTACRGGAHRLWMLRVDALFTPPRRSTAPTPTEATVTSATYLESDLQSALTPPHRGVP